MLGLQTKRDPATWGASHRLLQAAFLLSAATPVLLDFRGHSVQLLCHYSPLDPGISSALEPRPSCWTFEATLCSYSAAPHPSTQASLVPSAGHPVISF